MRKIALLLSLIFVLSLFLVACGEEEKPAGGGDPTKTADPTPTEPAVTTPGDPTEPVDPGPEDPGPADPGPADPGPADPGPADPGPEDPGPADPGPADPGPADPGPADPGPADPGPADPGPAADPYKDTAFLKNAIGVADADIAAYWNFNNASKFTHDGKTAYGDNSGNGNALVTDGTSVAGLSGQGLQLKDGQTAVLIEDKDLAKFTETKEALKMTINVVMKLNEATGGYAGYLELGGAGGCYSLQYHTADAWAEARMYGYSRRYNFAQAVDEWFMYTYVWDGSVTGPESIKPYRNGEMIASTNLDEQYFQTIKADGYPDGDGTGFKLVAKADAINFTVSEIAIIKKALSESDVKKLCAAYKL